MNSKFLQQAGRQVAATLGRGSFLVRTLRPVYESVLARLHGGRGIPWTINGEPYRIDPRFRHLMGEHWDAEVASFLAPRLKPGALCFDVGANAGVYVLQFCRWTGPDGRVIAFEPNPNTRRVLRSHLAMNDVASRVELVPDAVSEQVGEAEFFFAEESGMSRLGEANSILREIAQSTTVKTVTLDYFCRERKLQPDCLLIDIEGFELQALRGARELLAGCPDLQLIVEMHPQLWPSAGISVEDWTAFFEETNLRPVALMGQHDVMTDTGSVYFQRR